MSFWKAERQQQILAEELQGHLDELKQDLIASGYSPEDATLEARRQFGNRTTLLERSRAVWRIKWIDALSRDLRFTWRLARRQPWTMAAAIASIAIGVGANTAVTSVVDTVLLNPLGIRNSSRIVVATVHLTKLQMIDAETSGAELRDLRSLQDTFSSVAATENRAWTFGGDQPTRLLGIAVTPEFFRVFDQKPALGHFPDGSNANEVVLSHTFWQSHFAQDSGIIGRKLMLDNRPYKIAAVASPNFHYPATAEAWIPLLLTPDRFERGNNMSLSLYARLSDNLSRQQAQTTLDHFLSNLSKSPDGLDMVKLGYGIDLRTLSNHVAGDLQRPLILLWSAASLLLLTACGNVAGLLLARAGSRRKEMAIRISIGAGKLQILRQLVTESLMLALLGGSAGLLLTWLCLQVMKNQPLPYQHLLLLVTLNYRLLAYGFFLALLCSLLFGAAPAVELLRQQHVGALVRSRRKWFQNAYIIGQVGAAMLLLVVTGLLLKSLKAIESLHPGFDSKNLTTAFLIKPEKPYPFFDRLLAKLQSSPGVESVALAFALPFGGSAPTSMFTIKGHQHQSGVPEWHAEAFQVTPGYFKTLHIPTLRGRTITDADTAAAPLICVIDSTLATRFFPDEDPIGQEIAMYKGYARIVGIVSAIRDTNLESISRPAAYYALAQIPYFPQVDVVVRSSVPAASLIRAAVKQASPAVPVFDIKTMDQRINASVSTRSVMASLVTIFAIISILLAAIGIHGVVSQVVAEHTSEIGIRMALGAKARDIFRRYAGQGLQLSLLGILIGLSLAAASQGWLQSFLYQIQPLDPATIALGVGGVLLVSLMAVLAPAWRASRIDPQITLRNE